MSEEMEDLHDSPYEDMNDDSWAPGDNQYDLDDPRRFQFPTTTIPSGIQELSPVDQFQQSNDQHQTATSPMQESITVAVATTARTELGLDHVVARGTRSKKELGRSKVVENSGVTKRTLQTRRRR